MDAKDVAILRLQKEIRDLRKTVETLQTHLEKYTNSDRHKRYYEANKDRIKQNARAYLERLKETNPEKLKEYRHRAYLRRKEREIETIDIEVGSDGEVEEMAPEL